MTDRNKPGLAFWATVVSIVALLYPLSFGPMVWLEDSGSLPRGSRETIYHVYGPLVDCALDRKHPIAQGLLWWAVLGCDNRSGWLTLWMIQPYVDEDESR